MTSEKLGTEKMKKLISCVRRHRHLWDTQDSNYKDKRMVAKSWNEVAKEMQIPVQMARSKFKNMRDMFNRELRKISGPMSCPEDYKGRWRHFKSLCFLLKPWERMETQYLDDVMDNSYEDDDDDDDNKAYIIKVGPDYVSNSNIHDTLCDSPNDDDFDDCEPRTKKSKPTSDDDDDYDMMFLKSLAPYMRSLSPARKLQVRNQIQEIFLEKIK